MNPLYMLSLNSNHKSSSKKLSLALAVFTVGKCIVLVWHYTLYS